MLGFITFVCLLLCIKLFAVSSPLEILLAFLGTMLMVAVDAWLNKRE